MLNELSLVESLVKLDSLLTERIAVPMRILMEDYTGVAGSDGTAAQEANCEIQYRLMATAWIGPWGSMAPWLLPPSTVATTPEKTTTILRLPQSRVRHFLADASLYLKMEPYSDTPRITRAVLRLGSDKILQSLDSEFACNISSVYKHGRRLDELATCDAVESSITLVTPLFFEMPLSVFPLFMPNTPLPEIEYDVSTAGAVIKSVRFFSETVSSPGEAGIQPALSTSASVPETIVQHLTTLTTFSAQSDGTSLTVIVPVSTKDHKLARALYIRVKSETCQDIADAIELIDAVGPPPLSRSIIGLAIPGSICRSHLKRRFSNKRISKLPYYVFPFCATPTSRTADYAVQLVEGSQVRVVLNPHMTTPVTVEVCIETFERVTWKR